MQTIHAQLRQIIQAEMAMDAGHDIAHLDRVWASVQDIVAGEGDGDLRILLAATYLHDLVNLPKDSPERAQASTLAAKAAPPILAELGFEPREISAVQHAIAAHSYSAGIPPQSIEAEILRDADRLDALGAIGIARAFAVAGVMGTQLYAPDDPFAQSRDLDDRRFALDHWRLKLLGLGEGFKTKTARQIARRRLDFMQGFLDQLAGEIGAEVAPNWRN